jgi:hypothetical protein
MEKIAEMKIRDCRNENPVIGLGLEMILKRNYLHENPRFIFENRKFDKKKMADSSAATLTDSRFFFNLKVKVRDILDGCRHFRSKFRTIWAVADFCSGAGNRSRPRMRISSGLRI